MKVSRDEIALATGFYTGYIPIAQGTFGSLLATFIYCIPGFENPWIMSPIILITFIYGVRVCTKMESLLGKDPSECTIDEFVGTWISYLFLPKIPIIIIITFFIWRILDILKPLPANLMENISGGWGIMLDDVVSGFYAAFIVHLMLYFNLIPY
ncbi:MAG: phosphatidylglycerophosphatase A [Bacteroidetes bacterium]|nr:phosphatidylglycerophosphatase A [Bacteroidota bacterium]